MAYRNISFDENPQLKSNQDFATLLAAVAGYTADEKNPPREQIIKAFQELKGLDKLQMYAIIEQGFTRKEVLSKNFGVPTALGVDSLTKLGLTTAASIDKLIGLDASEIPEVVTKISTELDAKIPFHGLAKSQQISKSVKRESPRKKGIESKYTTSRKPRRK